MPLVPHRDIVWSSGALPLPSATYNDLALSDDHNEYAMSTVSGATINGVVPTRPGRPIWLHNIGIASVTLTHNSGSAAVGTKLWCPGGSNATIASGDSAMIVYSQLAKRWAVWVSN